MPEEVQNPRVVFQDGRALIACRIQTSRVKTVLSLALEAHLTDQPNEIAIRVAKVRAGLLPVPMKEILEKVSQAATAANISLRWTQSDGDPVALVQFPDDLDDVRPGVRLKTIAIEPGQLSVGGSATPAGDTPHP